jgi:hypothetical protein
MAELMSPDAVETARKEIRECKTCQEGGMMPSHLASAKCESNGRRWDPEKKEMVGYPHCSCDTCF